MKKRRMKKILIVLGACFGLLIVGAGGYIWYLYHSVQQVADQIYEKPVKSVYVSKDPEVKTPEKAPEVADGDAFTVLLLGVDERIDDPGRSDTIIVMTVNPAKKSVLMFNIPRDTRVPIVGHNTVDKINHAYAFGGVEMSINTVEQFIDYPIDYYMKVNMGGFAQLIDMVGGVDVDNPFTFTNVGHEFQKGHLHLNGQEALLYSRMRYDDPRGDLGRNARQRELLQEAMRSSLNLTNLTKVKGMLTEVGKNVKTDITFDDMKKFLTDYRPDIETFNNVEIKGAGQTIDGIWYYIVDDSERTRIHNAIKSYMANGTTVVMNRP